MLRLARLTGPAALVLAGFVALVAALLVGGGADTPGFGTDPGALVRFGLPTAKLLVNLATALTLGALVLACFALSAAERAFARALDVAAGAAAVWTVASLAASLLTFLSLGVELTLDDRFGEGFSAFLTTVELGQAWLGTTLLAAAVTVVCFAVRNQTLLAFVAVGVVLGQLPLAQQGHAGGTEDHGAAVIALWMHIAGAGVWLGGLATIALLLPELRGERLGKVLPRYSTLAIVCFTIVAASGYVRAEIAIGAIERLASPYGLLVLAKVGVLVALGLFGAVYRRRLIARIEAADRPAGRIFGILAVAELAFMGVASGVAAALGRTAPPDPEIPASELAEPTPAQLLTGRELPPEPDIWSYLTQWNLDLLWILACAFGLFFYLAAVFRLRQRGDSWPVLRTVAWISGLALLFLITNGGLNVYQPYLFSAHMLAHMALGMMVPLLLVPGAPITLALRAIRKRTDGSRGGREWLLAAVHSRYAAVLGNPVVAAVLFTGSLWLFYYSPLFSWAMTDHVGHHWMVVHFLATGFLFVQVLIGSDPLPYRAPYPLRLVLLLATMAFHAFFGLALMTGSGLLLADWYGAMGREWGDPPLVDQQNGGGIAWSVGEIPTVILAIVVALQWARSDDREAKRVDRAADRDGDAELEAYNAMLAARAERDRTDADRR
ncbi:cytochrome c oxidase assembly protein [Lysobacter korlensis]|uniref:Copper resistance protein D n=1 Tax=Lysobacter korlensis TaxID=553636 RepID=A0ABV6RTT3_9GAMM